MLEVPRWFEIREKPLREVNQALPCKFLARGLSDGA